MDPESKFAIHAACREGKRESGTIHVTDLSCRPANTLQFQRSSLC